MKKAIMVIIAIAGFGMNSSAQVNPHAIGVRGGAGNLGFGGEISYQHGLGDANRLELDLGWRGNRGKGNDYSSMYVAGIYHWVWNLTDGLNWYAGPGAVLGLHSDNNNSTNDGLTIGVGGQLGIEYDFNTLGAPLLLGLDTRPMWRVFGYGNGSAGYGASLSLRFTF